jgi:hypothetical protein
MFIYRILYSLSLLRLRFNEPSYRNCRVSLETALANNNLKVLSLNTDTLHTLPKYTVFLSIFSRVTDEINAWNSSRTSDTGRDWGPLHRGRSISSYFSIERGQNYKLHF